MTVTAQAKPHTGRHRAPQPPRDPHRWLRTVAIADGGMFALGITVALAASLAPHPMPPRAAATPTAVELVREPSGHGGPMTPPTIAADLPVWEPADGPVIVDQQPLPRATAPAPAPAPAPEPVQVAGLPPITTAPAPTATAQPTRPRPPFTFPIDVVVDVEPDVTPEPQPEPQPDPTPDPEPTPTDPPADETPEQTDTPTEEPTTEATP